MGLLGTNNSTTQVAFKNPTTDSAADYTPIKPGDVAKGKPLVLGGGVGGPSPIGALPFSPGCNNITQFIDNGNGSDTVKYHPSP